MSSCYFMPLIFVFPWALFSSGIGPEPGVAAALRASMEEEVPARMAARRWHHELGGFERGQRLENNGGRAVVGRYRGDCVDNGREGPWDRDLILHRSDDGLHFDSGVTLEPCADVPSIAQGADGTLIAIFQSFAGTEPHPITGQEGHPAIRWSRDGGKSWSSTEFVSFEGFPPEALGRAYDPTLTYDFEDDLWRVYFTLRTQSGDKSEIACTHSAVSENGFDYLYAGLAFCDGNHVPDPAVVQLDGRWHYSAPRGAPNDGAYYATSEDGVEFTRKADIPSDHNHNLTGNFTVSDGSLFLYAAECNYALKDEYLFRISSDDEGETWSDFVRTDVLAGKDPGVIKTASGAWLMLVPVWTPE